MKGLEKMVIETIKRRLKEFVTLTWIPLISNQTKLFISFCLLVLAFLIRMARPEWPSALFCSAAMGLCFVGDTCLNSMPIEKRPHALLYTGAGAFMVGHVCYAIAYIKNIIANSYAYFNPGTYIAIGFMICFLIVAAVCIKGKKLSPVMIGVFGFYIFVIGFNFISICSYSYSAKSLAWIGALWFLASDFIIGIETIFKLKKDILRKLVWLLYPAGQFIILVCQNNC
ncbi:MAG: hypothetical protein IJN50_06120 [Clostridia bacterium]|nr:hypothetical protein [Clostridia bacterium]